jgi:hypothetical protein
MPEPTSCLQIWGVPINHSFMQIRASGSFKMHTNLVHKAASQWQNKLVHVENVGHHELGGDSIPNYSGLDYQFRV